MVMMNGDAYVESYFNNGDAPIVWPGFMDTTELALWTAYEATKARLPELARLVSAEDWTFTRNLIHGPMQEVGREMLYINQRLDRSQRKEADKIARKLKEALADLDEAARLQDSSRLQRSYSAVAAGFDAYSDVIPAEGLS